MRACSALFLVATLVGSVAAQTETPVNGKLPSEWLTILREHPELRYRRVALIPLETIGAKARGVTKAVIGALQNDAEPTLRKEAALVLGRMGPDAEGAAAALARALRNDKSDLVRAAAATALGGTLAEQSPEVVPDLAAALKDSSPATRAAAAEALKSYGDNVGPAVPALLALARNRKEEHYPRIFAVQIASRYGKDNPETAAVVAEILGEPNAPTALREAAAEAAARLGRPSAATLTALGQMLQEKSTDQRRAAAAALAVLGEEAKDAWPAIQTGLKDPDNTTRYQLIRAAGGVAKANPAAVTALTALAQKEDSAENRVAAVQELGALGPRARDARPVLERIAVQDVRASVRAAAAAALQKIAKE